MSGFYTWSRTASANASADNAVNWAEGMAPSAVNDSGRGMMASAAKWRDDISGALVTSGSPTAYTVASYQGFDTLAHLDGQQIAFTPHFTNGATVTLAVDGLGAKPLRSAPGVELPAAMLIAGSPYVVTYYNATGEFILQGFHQLPEVIPIGGCIPYLGTTVPNSNFAFPFGQTFSRTVYSKLFALVGTTFGPGDGSTTFNGPDIRGRAFFGLDNMGGNAANRITSGGSGISGATVGAAGGAETVTLTSAQIPAHTHPNTLNDPGHTHTYIRAVAQPTWQPAGTFAMSTSVTDNTSTSFTGITINNAANTGGNGAHTNMPPAFICPVIMRII
ncbi:microcystin-dependent protein [Nitrobacteraceae bacterium AZCC 1564]